MNESAKMGEAPAWCSEDVTPGLCDEKHEFQFLFQIYDDCDFKTKFSAPRQMGPSFADKAELRNKPYYNIFMGISFYAFGAQVDDEYLVYFIPQRCSGLLDYVLFG